MKTKRLIELLQKEDPTGESEVLVGNDDIHFLEWKPGYYDGCYTILNRDPSKEPYYDIVGAQYRSDGSKLCIRTMNWEDVISNNVDTPVEVVDTFCQKRMQNQVDDWRKEVRRIKDELDKEFFDKHFPDMEHKIKEGWKIIQPSTYKIGHYNVMWIVKNVDDFKEIKDSNNCYISNDNQIHFNQGQCGIVIKSGKFKPIHKQQFIEWELI
jgi:hypothetical protein